MKVVSAPEASELACITTIPSCSRRNSRPAECVTHHAHIELNLVTNGSVTYLCGGTETQVGAGRLVAFWSAIPHQVVEVTPDVEYFVMTVPLERFLQCRLPETFTHRILGGQVLVDQQANLPADLDRFERWGRDLRSRHTSAHRIVLLEVEARLLRFAEGLSTHSPSSRHGDPASPTCDLTNVDRIRQILCFIVENYTDQITLELVSKSLGLHPTCTMSFLRKTLGTTFVHYLTRLRTSHAQHLLAISDERIIDVALAAGFNSLSRFNEVFKKTCGCSPCEYRERCRKAGLN